MQHAQWGDEMVGERGVDCGGGEGSALVVNRVEGEREREGRADGSAATTAAIQKYA